MHVNIRPDQSAPLSELLKDNPGPALITQQGDGSLYVSVSTHSAEITTAGTVFIHND